MLRSLLNELSNRTRRRKQALRHRQRRRLFIEGLEARQLLAAIQVDTTVDALNGDTSSITNLIATPGADGISLREAITAANNTGGADMITFAASTDGNPFTLTIANTGGINEDFNAEGDLDVRDDLVIQGNGSGNTIIQAGTNASNGIDRVIGFNPDCITAMAFDVSGVTLRYGRNSQATGIFLDAGGGVDFCGAGASSFSLSNSVISDNTSVNGYGGGINIDEVPPAASTVTITNTTIANNSSDGTGGGINVFGDNVQLTVTGSTISGNQTTGAGSQGGGVNVRLTNNNDGDGAATPKVTIENTLVSSNVAGGPTGGGGISVSSASGTQEVVIRNTTISGNTALADGGGVVVGDAGATVTLTNVTVSDNRADSDNNSLLETGGGINQSTGNVILQNTIVAGNFVDLGSTADDITGTVTANFSLIGEDAGAIFAGGSGNNLTDVNALLGPLANNGGTTQTHKLLAGSPALDNGSDALATTAGLTTDQRGTGFSRSLDAADSDTTNEVDIGAHEAHPAVQDIADQAASVGIPLVLTFDLGDFDEADGGDFDSVAATSSNPAVVPNANAVVSGTGANRTLTITAISPGMTTITLTVTDTVSGSLQSMSDTFVVTATLPVNTPPQPSTDVDPAANAVAEGAAAGTTVGVTANAFDAEGQTLVYSLTDDAGGRFTIDSSSGVVTVASGGSALLNFEDATSHLITVQAQDTFGATSSADFTIDVTNVNPTTPADDDAAANVVDEGATGAVGIDVSSVDPNGTAMGGNVTFSLTNDAGGRFQIDANTGVVTVNNSALLDGPATHTITVSASDGAGGTATANFNIDVNNVNPVVTSLVVSAPEACGSSSSNNEVDISGTFTDAGVPDTHTVLVDWGDGSPLESVSVNQLADTFSGNHVYATGGAFTISVTAVDDDGGASLSVSSTAVVQGVGVVDGTLYIVGTEGRDHVNLQYKANQDELKVHAHLNQGGGGEHIQQTFTASSINRIVAFLCGGDDHYNGGSNAATEQFVFGGAGDDHLQGGSGNDVLSGGSGNDHLQSESGRDILIGGTGKDHLQGGQADDLLIGGSAANENDLAAVDAALADWASGNLAGALIDLGAITDDGDKDHLQGQQGTDVLIGGIGDTLQQ